MVKSVSFRTYSRYAYVAFALVMLLLCWEMNKMNTALATAGIPEEAIRLRILANSDTVQDQAVKRLIRDAIVAEISSWVAGPASIEEARGQVLAHLPEIHLLIAELLEQKGFAYTFQVELGQADFPTKLYGSRVYPAGSYEALKVTLGGGEGQNWWCVLFPPLCFVDAASGEAVADPADNGKQAAVQAGEENGQAFPLQKKQYRFFLADALQGLISSIRSLF
ncbi:hypothetical protein J31TS4_42050 [Paenibacillus sp. J31TS4]|uniref:stage II sporulation protein R n=1 Tax=Paenibacillus sp. J31TS4 TaxID=2807195 RepID=UPI001B209897|nr:stage II sporulation protein R [Paenibacillus sp. J31TS4]GIP40925.1 hypothetical protein J31TS4_42050 [Paenibacillus sp. J31TS4]